MSALLLALAAAGSRVTVGAWEGWAAFRDATPPRCYAIARPVLAGGRSGGFASVGNWPARGVRGAFHVRLSRMVSGAAAVTLTVGERRFVLAATGRDAWAADAAADRAIVAALRSARSMSVEGVGGDGQPFADTYALAGAATAIDAAALACLAR